MDDLISDAVRNKDNDISGEFDDSKPAEYYIRLASESSGAIRQQYLIKAAQLLYQRGDISSAQQQLSTIRPEDVEGARHTQIQLLAARIALANDNPTQAIELLPAADRLNTEQYIEASEIRADANVALGYFMAAVRTRAHIDELFVKPKLRNTNHEKIWTALLALPAVILTNETSEKTDIQGWLELARMMRNAQTDISGLQNDILNWGTRFPQHPVSNDFIDRLLDAYLANYTATSNIAVLLPLQGRYKSVTDAIKGGFLSAYYDDSLLAAKPKIRFYDTSESGFEQLYQQAVSEGANYIVGPIDKDTINRLASITKLDVPVLTLNYATTSLSTTSNLYQFGLLPEDEAIQAAELAIRQDKMNAAILVPSSEWGQRLQQAFKTRFEELGGKVHAVQNYDTKSDDYTRPIKELFNLDDSTSRHRDLERLFGAQLEYSPYRRQDIDMIFLAATYHSARGIMPAFKFHHAGDLQVYSTSHVYAGHINKSADMDLNDLLFCDSPWTLLSGNDNPLKKTFESTWPEMENFTRLFALGIDAYNVIRNLNYLESQDYARFSGQTGNIYLDDNRRLHRELLWARFKKGLPTYINTTTSPLQQRGYEKDKS